MIVVIQGVKNQGGEKNNMAGRIFKVQGQEVLDRPKTLKCTGSNCLYDGFIYHGQARVMAGRGNSKKPWHEECFLARNNKSRADAMYRRVPGSCRQ